MCKEDKLSRESNFSDITGTTGGSVLPHTLTEVFSFWCKACSPGPGGWSPHRRCWRRNWSKEGWGQKKNRRSLPLLSPCCSEPLAPRTTRWTISPRLLGNSAGSWACWDSPEAGAAWSAAARPGWVRTTSAEPSEICRGGIHRAWTRFVEEDSWRERGEAPGWSRRGRFGGVIWWMEWFCLLRRGRKLSLADRETLMHLLWNAHQTQREDVGDECLWLVWQRWKSCDSQDL